MRRDWLILAALLTVITLLALPALTYPLGRDQGEFATIGRGILNGRAPYVELWNPKPPAVFYVYALAMAVFGQTSTALRAIDLIIVPLICLTLYQLAKHLPVGAGLKSAPTPNATGFWAALVFAVFYFTETFWTLTQNDGIVLLPMALAMLCMFNAARQGGRSRLWAFGCGALSALTLWFKYPFALFVAAVMIGYVWVETRRMTERNAKPLSLRSPMGNILAFSLGGLLVGLGGIAYLASIGAWEALLESAQVTSSYTALTFNPQDFMALMTAALGFRWGQWGLLFVLVAIWPILAYFRRGVQLNAPTQISTGQVWTVIWLWASAGLAIMLVQAKGYDYHWLPMLPPLALIAGDTIARLIDIVGAQGFAPLRKLLAVFSIFVLLAILFFNLWPKAWPYLTGQETQAEYYAHFQAGEFVADESIQVANLLRERVVPGDSLFIWGFRPEVYYLSGLNPATRFIFQFPLVGEWYPQAWREETVDTLWAAMPPYVLVLQVDYMPWVTGRDEDSNTLLQEFQDLNDWLIYNYEPDTQIGNFFVWKRKP
jgi:4-amino-4-deoxy-L-arabinose transferase-like glycosyltransferase